MLTTSAQGKYNICPESSILVLSLYPCSLRERPHGSGCNSPRDFGLLWGHKAQLPGHGGGEGGSQGPGHRCPGGYSGPPSRGRDAGRRRHPTASPLDGATNPAWSRRRASPALPDVPSPGCCVSRWPRGSEGGPRQRPAPSPHLHSLCRGTVPAVRWAHTHRWCSKRRPRCRVDALPRGSEFFLVLWAPPLCCLKPAQECQ